ncbi:hypothetical protein [Candidatus Rhabdochlamydia porcellionis]|jgi:hypothetical protein|uniref:RanBP2-type domain-containing protein n=1 Tax=Candidatus Rhabdochlamydia porcellionis TaxID=225148 RepID=A0ABX8Z4Y6_9BACT|nr:hypothetical protein [Candidatus Rhabdochlamydia porcellionis]QZA59186.1 hypothetical protein RHAB15C_0001071 [Candidatus Rhabdochlamydia porcellionis]
MKNLLKLFGLSIVLSIAGLNALEASSEKIYVDSEDITFEDGIIYLHLENGASKPVTAVYSDEKGVYVLDQNDPLDQSTEPEAVCTQDNQDESDQPAEQEFLYAQDDQVALDQASKEEALCTQNAYRKFVADYECSNCSCINPSYRKTCKDCGAIIIH